jgi:hypothetical protein
MKHLIPEKDESLDDLIIKARDDPRLRRILAESKKKQIKKKKKSKKSKESDKSCEFLTRHTMHHSIVTELCSDVVDDFDPYGNGIIVKQDETLIAYRDDGTSVELYEGAWNEFKGYGRGVILRNGKSFIAVHEDGTQKVIWKGESDNWAGYGNGIITGIEKDNGTRIYTAHTEDEREVELFKGKDFRMCPSGRGLAVEKNDKIRLYKDDGSSVKIYEGEGEIMDSYGFYNQGVIIRTFFQHKHDDGKESKYERLSAVKESGEIVGLCQGCYDCWYMVKGLIVFRQNGSPFTLGGTYGRPVRQQFLWGTNHQHTFSYGNGVITHDSFFYTFHEKTL